MEGCTVTSGVAERGRLADARGEGGSAPRGWPACVPTASL
jgi:hypothetical protein